MTISELAADAFDKAERVRMLEMMNTPLKYEDRKKAFIELAEAKAVANAACATLVNEQLATLRAALERIAHGDTDGWGGAEIARKALANEQETKC